MISDVLRVSYDKDFKSYLSISRLVNGEIYMLNEKVEDQADKLYNTLIGKEDTVILCSAKTAREMVEAGDSQKVKEQFNIIASEIKKQIDEGKYSASFDGFIYEANKRKLESLGYKVYSGSQYNEDYYNVSWREA